MPEASAYGPKMPEASAYGPKIPEASAYGPKMPEASAYGSGQKHRIWNDGTSNANHPETANREKLPPAK